MEEKKVEYLELIYDLIFVYIIGRNNSLLHDVESGFVRPGVFLAYIISSLAIIQIWNYSTFYTNMHGRNSIRDHVFMFINMFLLYFIGEGTRIHWEGYLIPYNTAWALILFNIGVQYLLEYRDPGHCPEGRKTMRGLMTALFGEAAIILLAIPAGEHFQALMAGAAVLYGISVTWMLGKDSTGERIDFNHLSERAMLYVVFTFGEMIIAAAAYFEDELSLNTLYFAGMTFLIVAGLFVCYEILYDHIIDREQQNNGLGYMMLHILLVFGLNSITTSLEFMRNPEISLWPKTILLNLSFLLIYGCMAGLFRYAKPEIRESRGFSLPAILLPCLFVVLMLLFMEQMAVNIMISVLFVSAQALIIGFAAKMSA